VSEAVQSAQPEARVKKPFTKTPWYWVLMVVGVIVAICLIAAVAEASLSYGKVHEGISVRGVDVGGKNRVEATAAISQVVQEAVSAPITVKSGSRSWSVTPKNMGVSVDVTGAVFEAMAVTRKPNLFADLKKRFELYFTPVDLPLRSEVDGVRLDEFVRGVADSLHVAPIDADLAIQGNSVVVVGGVTGQDVDTATLTSKLQTLLLGMKTGAVDVPLIVKQPSVLPADLERSKSLAQTMLGTPIILTNHDKTWTLSPEQLSGYLAFRWEEIAGVRTLTPYLAEGGMSGFLGGLGPQVKVLPKDAALSATGDTIKVTPSVDGETLDVTATAAAINDAATKADGRTVALALIITRPAFTTELARAESFHDKLSSYTTRYSCPANRQNNVRLATKYSTNVFLAPGQEFNFDKQIGPRTASRGWSLAPGITGPNTLEDVLGGGICQVSTTMFNAVFEAGLKVTERHNHSIFINHYPLGRDATVTGGGKNLRYVNDTAHYIWIRGTSTGVVTTITIMGTSDGRKVTSKIGSFYNVKSPGAPVTIESKTLPAGTRKTSDAQTGRSLKTYRTVTLPDGTVLHNDVWTSVWPAYPPTVIVGTG
jgi:vancomycin resistance protein YoaR